MKLTFIGAGGVRTPLVVQSILNFQDKLPLDSVWLMDIDPERLELIKLACKPRLAKGMNFSIEWTTDARKAIQGLILSSRLSVRVLSNRVLLMNRCL